MKKCYFYIVATAFLFGTMEIAIKYSGSAFDPIQLTFLRFFIGGLILLPLSIADMKKKNIRLSPGDWGYLLFLGTVCVGISMPLMQISLKGINANMVAVIISSSPLFTMIFAHFVANDPFTRRKAVSLVLMIIGLVICSDPSKVISGDIDLFYLSCIILASATFGFYTAFGKRRIGRIGGITQNALSFLLGCAVLLAMMLLAGIPVVKGICLETAPMVIYLGMIVTGMGYFCYLKIVEISTPSMASIVFFLKPIIAPILAFIILGEEITSSLVFGLVFMLSGSYINLSQGLKKKA